MDLKELIRDLDKNPLVKQAVLRHANSPVYGFERRLTDVRQAVVLLGLERVKNFMGEVMGGEYERPSK